MKGELLYVRGAGFDAQLELKGLAPRVDIEQRHSGYWSGLRLLRDIATIGFSPAKLGPLFEKTDVDDVLLFEDSGFRLAFDVPGNGRHATPDIALLAAEFCALSRKARLATRADFVAKASERRRKGEHVTWLFVKRL